MAAVANIIGVSFDSIAVTRIAELKAAMGVIIGAELGFIVPILRALLGIFIGRQFFLCMNGYMTVKSFIDSITRSLIIVLLLVHAGQYVQRVETPVFDTIPQTLSNLVLSAEGIDTNNTDSVATQFDKVAQGADAVTALIVSHNTGWSVSGLVNSATAYLADGGLQIILAIICAIWLLGQTLLAIILCFGPCILVFELFDRTRHLVDQWIGKLVGITAFGFATSILLGIQMQGLQNLLRQFHDNMPTSSGQAIGIMFHIGCDVVLDALTMVALPTICSFGSGIAASLAAPSALALARTVSVGKYAAKLATGAARTAGSGGPNSIR